MCENQASVSAQEFIRFSKYVTRPKRPSGISRNLLSNWLAFLFVAITGFFLSPLVVNYLGISRYGIWTLLVALVGYLGLLDFGVRGAVTRYVAHHHASGDSDGCSLIVSAGLAMFGMLGIVAILLAAAAAYLSPLIFNIPESLVDDTRIVLAVGGLTMAVTMIGAVFGGVVAGLERFDVSSGIEIVVTALRTIAIILALMAGSGLIMLALIHLASSVVSGISAWISASRLFPALRVRFRQPLLPHIRTILSFSLFLSAIHVLSAVIYYNDFLVIAIFLPVSSVAYFAIAGNLCDYARQVASTLSVVMTPRVSALVSSESTKVAKEILGAARIGTLITAPIATTFFFRGESFINLWMGNEYGEISGEILKILAFVVLLVGARNVTIASIIGMNKHVTLVPILAFEAACNVVLSVTFVQALGLTGVAWGTLIPSLIVGIGLLPRCLNHATGIPIKLYFLKAWLLPIAACVPFGIASALTDYFFPARNLVVFFTQVGLTVPLVVICAMFLCMNRFERRKVLAVFREFVTAAPSGRL